MEKTEDMEKIWRRGGVGILGEQGGEGGGWGGDGGTPVRHRGWLGMRSAI